MKAFTSTGGERGARRPGSWWLRASSGAALLLVVACRRDAPSPADTASRPVVLGPENVVVVQQGTIEVGPTLSGSLEAKERSVLVAEAAGSVEQVRVELGDRVRRGELLVRIEAHALANAVAAARTAREARRRSLALAERQAERTQRLVQAGALAEHDLELAQNAVASERAELARAQAALVSAEHQLAGATVRAPIDGVVSELNVRQGDVVTLGAALLTIIDPSSMRLRASVPSEALSALHVGASVDFEVRGLPGQSFAGVLERIGPAADPVTRQIPLLISLPNPTGRLVSGLFAEGRLVAERKSGLVLPSSAISAEGETASVRRVHEDLVEVVPVELGIRDPARERVEVTRGLSAGDRVLTGAARDLPPGTQVRLEGSPG